MTFKFIFLSYTLYFLHTCANCQVVKIKGRVVNTSMYPIELASIKSGNVGGITNSKGEFSFSIDSNKLRTNGLACSCVGYKTNRIKNINPNNSITIIMDEDSQVFADVTVSSGASKLVEKAIEKIVINYPTVPFIQTGLLRLVFQQDNGYFYKNDAIIQAYTPSYKTREKGDVRLVKNKLNVLTGSSFDTTNLFRFVKFYQTPTRFDFVHNRPEFINVNTMKYFSYSMRGKEYYENNRVFAVNFFSHEDIKGVSYSKMEGTLFIDTASYAFVGGHFVVFDVKELFFNTIIKRTFDVSYQNDIVGKWVLKQIHSDADYTAKRGIKSQSSIDYSAISSDFNNVKRFPYESVIQARDVTQKVNNIADSVEWKKYDSLFVKAEKDSNIRVVELPDSDTLKNQSAKHKSNHNDLLFKVVNYLLKDNYRFGITVSKLPFQISSNNKSISSLSKYSLGFIGQLRIYKTLFLQTDNFMNWGLGGLTNKQTGYYLANEFSVNKKYRPIYAAPFVGYNKTTFSDSNIQNCVIGLNASFELTHKFSVLVSGSYNYNLKGSSSILPINNAKYSYSSGVIYKF